MLEGSGASRLVQLMRQLGHNRDTDVRLCEVVGVNPVRIKLGGSGLEIPANLIVVAQHLTEYNRETTTGGEISFKSALKVGDAVIVITADAGQSFYVIDKAVVQNGA